MTTLNLTVAADADDAEETSSSASFLAIADTTISLDSNTAAGSRWNGGFRFANATIPAGATVAAATFSIWLYSTTVDDANVTIYCEDVDDSVDFATTQDVTSRTLTTASITWIGNAIAAGGVGYYSAPDMASVIQEVIDRPGWASGNAITVLCHGNSDVNKSFRCRSVFENVAHAAKLDITYTVASSGSGTPSARARVVGYRRRGRQV